MDLWADRLADAVGLAERGWTVTGADVSAVAGGRAAEHAREAGAADRAHLGAAMFLHLSEQDFATRAGTHDDVTAVVADTVVRASRRHWPAR